MISRRVERLRNGWRAYTVILMMAFVVGCGTVEPVKEPKKTIILNMVHCDPRERDDCVAVGPGYITDFMETEIQLEQLGEALAVCHKRL